MQISGTTFIPNAGPADRNTTASDRKTAGQAAAQPQAQQDKVTISDAARQAQLQEQEAAQASAAASPTAAGPAVANEEAAANEDATPTDTTSGAKGFLYGALGLERPEKEAENIPPDGYTAGRWLSAALSAGTILSIVV